MRITSDTTPVVERLFFFFVEFSSAFVENYFTIYVRVYNNLYDKTNSEENLAVSMTEQLVEFTTLNIEKPKFVISTSENSAATIKLVDIIYPENNGNYQYTYEINGKEEVVNSIKTLIEKKIISYIFKTIFSRIIKSTLVYKT